MTLRIGSLFSGYGGLDLAVERLFDATTAWHSEIDPAASAVLAHHWPGIPNHGDITAIDWNSVEPVDIIAGGSPCQDLSLAGRRAGLAGAQSGLWAHMARAIHHLQPRYVVWENVQGALHATNPDRPVGRTDLDPAASRPAVPAAATVAGDLADLGYDALWTTFPASSLGGCHRRVRVFLLAWRRDQPAPTFPGIGPRLWGNPNPLLPTPTASLGRRTGGAGSATRRPSGHTVGLADFLAEDHADEWTYWGRYSRALDRHAAVLGREEPASRVKGPRGGFRVSPAFVEWMMMLPTDWVCGPLREGRFDWRDALRMLGNGVIPAQAMAALHLLAREV